MRIVLFLANSFISSSTFYVFVYVIRNKITKLLMKSKAIMKIECHLSVLQGKKTISTLALLLLIVGLQSGAGRLTLI